MFHLFLVPLNIFKAKPEEVKLKFIKYIENNLKSIVEHKEHMDKL